MSKRLSPLPFLRGAPKDDQTKLAGKVKNEKLLFCKIAECGFNDDDKMMMDPSSEGGDDDCRVQLDLVQSSQMKSSRVATQ